MIEARHRVDLYRTWPDDARPPVAPPPEEPETPPGEGEEAPELPPTEDPWGNPLVTQQGPLLGEVATVWNPVPVATGVPMNIQPLTGNVRQTAAGRQINVTAQGFVLPDDLPEGVSPEPDMGVVVVEGVGPPRYRITQVGERPAGRGSGWKTKVLLNDTNESIP